MRKCGWIVTDIVVRVELPVDESRNVIFEIGY